MFHPIAAIIETREKNPPDKIRTINIIDNNIAYSKCMEITVTLTNNSTSSVGFLTSTNIEFHFAQKLKIYRVLIKLKLLKIKKLCFNWLSNTHLINK